MEKFDTIWEMMAAALLIGALLALYQRLRSWYRRRKFDGHFNDQPAEQPKPPLVFTIQQEHGGGYIPILGFDAVNKTNRPFISIGSGTVVGYSDINDIQTTPLKTIAESLAITPQKIVKIVVKGWIGQIDYVVSRPWVVQTKDGDRFKNRSLYFEPDAFDVSSNSATLYCDFVLGGDNDLIVPLDYKGGSFTVMLYPE